MNRNVIATIFASLLATGAPTVAQVTPPPMPVPVLTPTPTPTPAKEGWGNETELNVVFTQGNSDVATVGFKNVLLGRWSIETFRLKLEALRTANADDWFQQADAGYTWLPGETPVVGSTSLVKPPVEPDAENYFAEARFDRTIRKQLNWHVGASWDRNADAGILNRYIVFGGLGNLWRDLDTLKLQTSYGLSWTDRQEETPDPDKEKNFAGVRLSLNYKQTFGKNTTFAIDWTGNMSVADTGDWSSDLTPSLSVSMSKRLSLRVSWRLLYNSEPALQDVDLVARVELVDPDGVPGSGDEYFQTVSSGGYEIVYGETRVRKESLDQIFKTGLVVSF
jgi:hypothetical protein